MTNFKELGINNAWDCHTHSGGVDFYNMFKGNLPYVQSVDDLVQKANNLGVARIITFPFPSTSYYDPRERGRASGLQDFPYQVENDALLKSCECYKDKVFPFLCIDPGVKQKEQLDRLTTLWNQKKFYGLKLHTLATGSRATDILKSEFPDFIIKNDIPLLIHSGITDPYSNPHYILELAKEMPTVRICVAHIGRLDEETVFQVAVKENLFTDCSPFLQLCDLVRFGSRAVARPNLIDIEDPVASLHRYSLVLKSHLLWGTDEPWTSIVEADGSYVSRHSYQEEVNLLSNLFKISPKAVIDMTTTNVEYFIFGK